MKSLDDTKPQTNNIKWEDSLMPFELKKDNEWYAIRIVGGTFSFSNHWISFVNPSGQEKKFPVGCSNWDQDSETACLDNGCLPCKLGIKGGVRYLLNVIDRSAQGSMRQGHSPIRVINLPPTALTKIIALKKLNTWKEKDGVWIPCQAHETGSTQFSITDPDCGCDVWIQWNTQGKKADWSFNKGDACSLTEAEREQSDGDLYELYNFDAIYTLPDPRQTEASLRRIGLLDTEEHIGSKVAIAKKLTVPEDTEQEEVPTPKVIKAPVAPPPPIRKPVVAPKPTPVEEVVEEEVVEEAEKEETPVPVTKVAPVKAVVIPKPVASNMTTASKLSAPPAADHGKNEKPACYGNYLGGVKCIKCSYHKACSDTSSADEQS